jgi:acylglycerol lipase
LVCVALLMLVTACSPKTQVLGISQTVPSLGDSTGVFVSIDGARLPLRVWLAEKEPKAVIIALHGFNDYGNAFHMPAQWWAARGITTYAYDQRGFGGAPDPGLWGSEDAMIADVKAAVGAARLRHPDMPLYLLGESMGGAVVMSTAAALRGDLPVDGLVLTAPAVWGWSQLNPLYRSMLWLSAHTLPWKKATGKGVKVTPSDNIEMLIALGRDPLIIKATRMDAIYGLVGLMERAHQSASKLRIPALILYGAGDDIIPPHAFKTMLGTLKGPRRIVKYERGFHMLLRDLQAETVWQDVLTWVTDREAPLPSGEEVVAPGPGPDLGPDLAMGPPD